MYFRTDDGAPIDPTPVSKPEYTPAPRPTPKPMPKEDSMANPEDWKAALARAEAKMDHDEAMRPKSSRDVRADQIQRGMRGDNAGQGAKDAREQMIDRMKGAAQ